MSDTGTSKSSYGRSSSLSRSSLYGSTASINREPSPPRTSRTDYDSGRFSRSDWTRKPVSYGNSSYTPKSSGYSSSSSSIAPRTYGSSYSSRPSTSSYTPTKVRPKTTDYVLTPFVSRRSAKTSDLNLTPFPSRISRSTSITTPKSTSTETYTEKKPPRPEATKTKPESTATKVESRRLRSKQDSPEQDEYEKDPNARYLTSRATSPLDSLFVERYRDRQKKKRISGTETKAYPAKVYKRKRDRPLMRDHSLQVSENEIDNIVPHKKVNRYEEYKATQKTTEKPRFIKNTPVEQNTVSISKAIVGNKVSKFESKQPEQSSPLAVRKLQSSFRVGVRPDSQLQHSISQPSYQYKDDTETDDYSASEADDMVVPQSQFESKVWKKNTVKPQRSKVSALTTDNLSLKDSIEKVKKWKRQLKDNPPEDWDFDIETESDDDTSNYQRQISAIEANELNKQSKCMRQISAPEDIYSHSVDPILAKPPSGSPRTANRRPLQKRASFEDLSTSEDETWFTRDVSPNKELPSHLRPSISIDSVASAGNVSSVDYTNDTGVSRAQSMLTLDTDGNSSLNWKKLPKAISMGSLASSVYSLPDLIPVPKGQVYIGGVQDIDSLLGFSDSEITDNFSSDESENSDSFFDAESEVSVEYNKDYNKAKTMSTAKNVVEEIVYISEAKDIDDIIAPEDINKYYYHGLVVTAFKPLTPAESLLSVPPTPTTATSGSSESLLDTPVPDTPDMPLAPVPLFQFPMSNTRTVQSMENLSTPLQPKLILKKPSPKLRRDNKARSMSTLDDLDSLLETIKITNKPKTHRRRKEDTEAFDCFSRECKDELIEEVEDIIQEDDDEEENEFCDASPTTLIPSVDYVDNVPVAKLVEFENGLCSTPSIMKDADYPKNYSAEAISKALWIEQYHGTITTKELLDICKLKVPNKPEWLLQQEDLDFSGHETMKELLIGMNTDVKKVSTL